MLNHATFKPSPKVFRSILPGAKPLGLTARNVTQLEQTLAQGLPVKVLKKLTRATGVTLEDVAVVLGVSAKTLASRVRKQQRLTKVQSFKLYRFARIFERACEVFGTREAARDWFCMSVFSLGNRTPLEAMKSDLGCERVLHLLERLDDGAYS